ncbi:MAG: hypothetical protein DRO11_10245 [Methanobacteriota archaeon]|nr:MAG: hypothetical protein DRO11_10245 [Euryarchaeota archaeon]
MFLLRLVHGGKGKVKIKMFVVRNKKTGKIEKWTVTTMTLLTSRGEATSDKYELLRVEEI